MDRGGYAGSSFDFLADDRLKLLLIGGKGGVGKTTIAAALSLYLSGVFPEKRFLVISTDPAHSLSDSFDYPLDDAQRSIYRRHNLFGMEIDAGKLLRDFRARHGPALKRILNRGTYLDDEDISRFLELSFPGLDEVMALIQIIDLLERNDYDLLVVDTAPTGHTLRLLALPMLMKPWVSFLDTLMAKHRYLSRVYTGAHREDEADRFIRGLAADIERIKQLLQDSERCGFVLVGLPEPVVLSETQRFLETLAKNRISVKNIVFNRVSDAEGCSRCRAVAEEEQALLRELKRRWPDMHVSLLPLFPKEVRGEERLTALLGSLSVFEEAKGRDAIYSEASRLEVPSVELSHPLSGRQFFLFGGKGGVGKTTLSCSFALNLSRRYPGKKILLFSTDPAHSLSDCLGQRVGSTPTPVGESEGLFALEMDPERLFREFKRAYAEEIEEIFTSFSRETRMDVRFDRQVLIDLLDLSPPGIDEIMALAALADYTELNEYDLYVLDMSPTGHTLRFLELPGLMQDWLRTFFEIILKYRGVLHLPKTSEHLIRLSKRVKTLKQIFSDPERCEFIPVAIPTEMALRETQRLLSHLGQLKIPFFRILINMTVTHPDGCDYCGPLAVEHDGVVSRFKESFADLEVLVLPLSPVRIAGTDALSKFSWSFAMESR